MKSKVWYARAGDFLVPTDEDSLKLLRKHEDGECIPFKPLRVRSLKWHKRYWLMLDRIAEHLTRFNVSLDERIDAFMPIGCAEDLHTAIKLVTGHCHTHVVTGSRYILRIPKSTDFESMTADEWSEYYPRVLTSIHERALPQIDNPDAQEDLARLAS